ncbi:hypothetical protein [Streptomyces sp. NPDC005969]|uniref:hypothetical protein n=1 Tax=Streptomyces sp. NPDC005969 TaxID=3156722 RepID=UPI0033CFA36D
MDSTYPWPPDQTFWASTFPEHTTTRTTPYLFKNIIPAAAAKAEDVLAGFAAIRRAHAAGTDIKAHARVYAGEERRDELLPKALAAPAWNTDTFDAFVPWMEDLVGAERFSLVINNLETVSPALAAGLGTFLHSLIDGWGCRWAALNRLPSPATTPEPPSESMRATRTPSLSTLAPTPRTSAVGWPSCTRS